MPNPQTSTRDRILHQGLALMSQSGLAGVTLGVLADQVGMSKSGLFAHFRSKEEVQIKLLEHTAEVGAAHIIAPSMQEPEGLPRLPDLLPASRHRRSAATDAGTERRHRSYSGLLPCGPNKAGRKIPVAVRDRWPQQAGRDLR